MRIRRRLADEKPKPKLSEDDWREIVLNALKVRHGLVGREWWGCIGRDKMIFRITTLEKERVPNRVLYRLTKEGLVKLNGNGFYVYVPPTKRVRRSLTK